MSRFQGTEDLRVRRTRKALREALFGLIVEKGYHSLSVGEITGRAMVNRATCYRHFRDKDFAAECVADTCAELLAAEPPEPGPRIAVNLRRPPANFLLLFRHIRQSRDLYARCSPPSACRSSRLRSVR